jgi:hypothetical protein
MTTVNPSVNDDTRLSPSFTIPIVLIACAVPIAILQVWVGGVIGLFGLFLTLQAATLRLIFTASDLDIYRGETLIRRFPYQDWQDWRIFYPAVPVLFYFKEVKSIHFLPILFEAKTLQACLEKHCKLAD